MARKSAAPPEEATTVVNIADFQRTRDSVIVALATLQSSVQDLSRAYIQHSNTVLGPGAGGALDNNLTNILTGSGLLSAGRAVTTDVALPTEEAAPEGKKKRKRAKHDPNAPKRALTPYFLFMQTARAEIARELGDSAKPKEVADEGTRRWSTMAPEDKHVWEESYQKNLAAYRVRMAAYKAGQPVPALGDAMALVEQGKAPSQAQLDAVEDDPLGDEEEEEDETSPEPVREPTPPKSNKRRKVERTTTPPKETPKLAAASPAKKAKKGKKEATPPPAPTAPTKTADKKTKSKAKKAA